MLSTHPSAEDAPPKKVPKRGATIKEEVHTTASPGEDRYPVAASTQATARMQARPWKLEADRSAATATGHGSQPATGPTVTLTTPARGAAAKRVEKENEEEEEKRQLELRRARDQLKKCLEDEDYTGAAAVKENIAALMSAEPCSPRNHGRSKADLSAVTAAGHGSQPATGPTVTSATLARSASAKRVEKEDEEEEKRQAELRRAQDQLKKCLEDEDYTGAAAVKENIAALMSVVVLGAVCDERRSHDVQCEKRRRTW